MRLRGALLSLALTVAACGSGDDSPADDDAAAEPDAGVDPDPDAAPPAEDHCGDGVLDPDEQCDDGGKDAGDGCAPTCFLERCGDGVVDPGFAVNAWLEVAGNCAHLTFAIDGTTVVQQDVPCTCYGITTFPLDAAALALLDDGEHDLDLDATTDESGGIAWATLVVETSWPIGPLPADRTTAIVHDSGEPGDAEARNPWICDQNVEDPVDASATIRLGEVCDDGDRDAGDGCRADCQGTEECQDGLVDVGEGCDDGNALDGDGCTAACVDEYCGDGVINDVDESCEDGNTVPGDGCEASCVATCGNGVADQPHRFLDGATTVPGVTGAAIAAGRIDADTDQDLVVVGNDSVHALLSDGAGGVTVVTSTVASGSVGDATLVDLNADGHLDLLVSSYSLGARWSAGDGAGNFAAAQEITTSANRQVAAADFDGDGRTDILAYEAASNVTNVYRNLGSGSFVPQEVSNTPGSIPTLPMFAAGDVDGDGKPDALAVRGPQIYIVRNYGPSMTYDASISLSRWPTSFAAGDFDGDNRLDAALGDQRVSIVFDVATARRVHERSFASPIVVAADLDADASRELLVASSNGNLVGIYAASAAGKRITAFGPALDRLGGSWTDVVALSLDGDALADLAAIDSGGAVHLARGYTGNAEACDDGNDVVGDGCDACALPACADDLGAMTGLAIDDTCYASFPRRTLLAARADCQTLGGDLAIIPDDATNTLVTPMVTDSVWLGLTDDAVEGTWVWVDGTSASYVHWAGGEPNNSGNEDCVQMYSTGFWNDLPCLNEVDYLCALPITP